MQTASAASAIARIAFTCDSDIQRSQRPEVFTRVDGARACSPRGMPGSGLLEHDPEKCAAVFRKDHAPPTTWSGMTIRGKVTPPRLALLCFRSSHCTRRNVWRTSQTEHESCK